MPQEAPCTFEYEGLSLFYTVFAEDGIALRSLARRRVCFFSLCLYNRYTYVFEWRQKIFHIMRNFFERSDARERRVYCARSHRGIFFFF